MDFSALGTFILRACPLLKGGSASAPGSVWLYSYFALVYVPWSLGLLSLYIFFICWFCYHFFFLIYTNRVAAAHQDGARL